MCILTFDIYLFIYLFVHKKMNTPLYDLETTLNVAIRCIRCVF
jgi:hypothetical protein